MKTSISKLTGVVCLSIVTPSLLSLASVAASAQVQPANTIQVQVRYKTEYGYKYNSGVFAGSGPTSCGAFSISAKPDPAVRQQNLYGIHNSDTMRESNGLYVCDFLVTDLPIDSPIRVSVDLADHRTVPIEAWKGGSQAQPPAGQQRTIITVGRTTSNVVTLTSTQPRARLVFDMIYAPIAGAVLPIDKIDSRSARDQVYANTLKPVTDVSEYRELRCRGGAGIRFVDTEGRTNSSGEQTTYMTVYYKRATSSGLNLQPGQCAFAERALRLDEPDEIILEVVNFGQRQQQLHGSPVDTSPAAAEKYPDAQNVPQYLADASHSWSFFVHQNAPLPQGRFEASSVGHYWKPAIRSDETVRPIESKGTTKDPYVLAPKKRH